MQMLPRMLPRAETCMNADPSISPKYLLKLDILVSPAGFEPATY